MLGRVPFAMLPGGTPTPVTPSPAAGGDQPSKSRGGISAFTRVLQGAWAFRKRAQCLPPTLPQHAAAGCQNQGGPRVLGRGGTCSSASGCLLGPPPPSAPFPRGAGEESPALYSGSGNTGQCRLHLHTPTSSAPTYPECMPCDPPTQPGAAVSSSDGSFIPFQKTIEPLRVGWDVKWCIRIVRQTPTVLWLGLCPHAPIWLILCLGWS